MKVRWLIYLSPGYAGAASTPITIDPANASSAAGGAQYAAYVPPTLFKSKEEAYAMAQRLEGCLNARLNLYNIAVKARRV